MQRSKPSSCIGCACYSHGSDFSAVEGTGANGVLMVGESSGEHEQRDQLPFRPYAPAGAVLTRILQRMGLRRESFAITNCLRCRPKNNWLDGAPWEYSALRQCRPNLDAAIATHRPRAILALGGIATRELTGMAGEAQGIGHLAGYVLPLASALAPCTSCITHDTLDNPFGERMRDSSCDQCHGSGYVAVMDVIPVVPNFHPSYLRRGKASHQGYVARIIQRALNVASGRDRQWLWRVDPDRKETYGTLRYSVHPSLDEARAFADRVEGDRNLIVSYDLETYESTSLDEDAREGFTDTEIRLVQFSVADGTGIAFPWEGAYREIAARVLRTSNIKCGHNIWLFDNKVLRAVGEREGVDYNPRGTLHDTLQMFHHWQPDLPAHLQFAASFIQFPFPWKHLASQHIEFYGCCDVDATLRLYNFLEKTLKADGLWGDHNTGYIGQVYELRPVLARMEDRGVPIDDAARVALDGEFEIAQQQLEAELQGSVPDEVRSLHPKEGYKKVPKDCTGLVERDFTVASVDERTGEPCNTIVRRWCRLEPFNPNSSQQMLRYMKAKGHPVPKDKHREDDEGNNPDTTNAKELTRLANRTGDTFYLKVIEYRGLTKMRGTYIEGFKPGADSRVHPTFTFATAIGQLTARNPNSQNFPKLKPTPKLAKAMRGMICADDGYMLTEIDFKSCHVITLGYLAGDENYTRLGRLDIHSFVAGHFLNLWDGAQIIHETDEQLLARFKWLKSDPERKRVRDDQAKHGILGIGNGLRARGLYERYMEQFPPRICPICQGLNRGADQRTRVQGVRGWKLCPECSGVGLQSGMRIAEQVLEVCEKLFPRIFEYQETQRKEAHERRELRTPFGFMRRFYEVYRPDPRNRGALVHGDQAEEAVAYRLANVAHAHMRATMKEVDARGYAGKYQLFNQIHDALYFHHPAEMSADVIRDVAPAMFAESAVMPGLWLGAEANQGRRWSEVEEVDISKEIGHGTIGGLAAGAGGVGAVAVGAAEVAR